MGLEGKVCIITGGGSGIGRATALMMAEEGATVIVVGRTASKVEAVRDEVTAAGGTAEAYGLDVADKPGIEEMVEDILARYGKVDVLVNNAGHSSPRRMLMTTTPEDLRGVYDSNLVGSVFCTQAVVPSMRDAGQGRSSTSPPWRRQRESACGDELQRGQSRGDQLYRVPKLRAAQHGDKGQRRHSGRGRYSYPGRATHPPFRRGQKDDGNRRGHGRGDYSDRAPAPARCHPRVGHSSHVGEGHQQRGQRRLTKGSGNVVLSRRLR